MERNDPTGLSGWGGLRSIYGPGSNIVTSILGGGGGMGLAYNPASILGGDPTGIAGSGWNPASRFYDPTPYMQTTPPPMPPTTVQGTTGPSQGAAVYGGAAPGATGTGIQASREVIVVPEGQKPPEIIPGSNNPNVTKPVYVQGDKDGYPVFDRNGQFIVLAGDPARLQEEGNRPQDWGAPVYPEQQAGRARTPSNVQGGENYVTPMGIRAPRGDASQWTGTVYGGTGGVPIPPLDTTKGRGWNADENRMFGRASSSSSPPMIGGTGRETPLAGIFGSTGGETVTPGYPVVVQGRQQPGGFDRRQRIAEGTPLFYTDNQGRVIYEDTASRDMTGADARKNLEQFRALNREGRAMARGAGITGVLDPRVPLTPEQRRAWEAAYGTTAPQRPAPNLGAVLAPTILATRGAAAPDYRANQGNALAQLAQQRGVSQIAPPPNRMEGRIAPMGVASPDTIADLMRNGAPVVPPNVQSRIERASRGRIGPGMVPPMIQSLPAQLGANRAARTAGIDAAVGRAPAIPPQALQTNPNLADMAGLGDRIRAQVEARVAPLAGLGDRIRADVEGRVGVAPIPGSPGYDLSGLGDRIRAQVNDRLVAAGIAPPMPQARQGTQTTAAPPSVAPPTAAPGPPPVGQPAGAPVGAQPQPQPQTQPAPATPAKGAPNPIDTASVGLGTPTGDKWDAINRWDQNIINAAKKAWDDAVAAGEVSGEFDPAILNVMKSHIAIETGWTGNPNAENPQGAYGLGQLTRNAWHADKIDFSRVFDPDYNLYWVGRELITRFADPANPNGWVGASMGYFSGSYAINGTTDASNGTTDTDYYNMMQSNLRELEAATQTATIGSMPQDRNATRVRDINTIGNETTVPVDETVQTGNVVGNAIIDYARQFLGYQYVLGAPRVSPGQDRNDPPETFDCSSFTQWLYYHATGKVLAPNTYTQINEGQPVNFEGLKPGDLVFHDTYTGEGAVGTGSPGEWGIDTSPDTPEHVGIYIGNGKMISAMNPSQGIQIVDITTDYWMSGFVGGRRLDW